MKTALYLIVVIASFALVEESAAGLLGDLLQAPKIILTDTEKITNDLIQGLTGTLGAVEKQAKSKRTEVINNTKSKRTEVINNTKSKRTEVINNTKSKGKETTDNMKQQHQKLKETMTELQNQMKEDLEYNFSKLQGNWQDFVEESYKKIKEIIDKNVNKAKSNIKPDDIKKEMKGDLKELASTTADRVKCSEKAKEKFGNELYSTMENTVDKWYKKAAQ